MEIVYKLAQFVGANQNVGIYFFYLQRYKAIQIRRCVFAKISACERVSFWKQNSIWTDRADKLLTTDKCFESTSETKHEIHVPRRVHEPRRLVRAMIVRIYYQTSASKSVGCNDGAYESSLCNRSPFLHAVSLNAMCAFNSHELLAQFICPSLSSGLLCGQSN